MKIAIIGTTAYQKKMNAHRIDLIADRHIVLMPVFDAHPDFTELEICQYNLQQIKEADEVHIFWDQRSMGTIFDFGMVFALKKPIKIIYMEPKTFKNVMEQYESTMRR